MPKYYDKSIYKTERKNTMLFKIDDCSIRSDVIYKSIIRDFRKTVKKDFNLSTNFSK
jgi:hypothetical protein